MVKKIVRKGVFTMNIEKTIKFLNIYMKKMNDIDEVEVVLINDELGF